MLSVSNKRKTAKLIRQIVLIYANKNGTGKKCTQIYENIQKLCILIALKMGYYVRLHETPKKHDLFYDVFLRKRKP